MRHALVSVGLVVSLAACVAETPPERLTEVPAAAAANVDQARLEAAASDPDNWLSYGGTYAEQRFSALGQINDASIGDLQLAWAVELDTNRGQEATPLVVDGVMYTSTAWSKVVALDAATGRVLWQYDPENIGAKGVHACCDVVNRGLAVWKGKLFVGTIDGRLIALDAASGKPLWSTVTVDQSKPYTITMAPRVVRGKVIIGNSGAELGVRGYVSAYDADTGKLVWRFYTVPGNPADGPDGAASDEALQRLALPTWHGEWWKLGGGGTVWDSVVYDQELNQLLIGVGNGSPWNHKVRSEGKGDNLFLSSIVAVDPDTGKYKWHYQANPGESWDFTNTQQITLATLDLGKGPQKVLMQAPKNGFFYVIDRTNGKFISAEPYVHVNWATGIDKATGRPIETSNARYQKGPFMALPSAIGGHAWQPMSYSRKTGLVYIPTMQIPLVYSDAKPVETHLGRWNTAVAFLDPPAMPGLPADLAGRRKAIASMTKGALVAWDPVRQKEIWRIDQDWPWNGGTLATAGNLVFQGDARGNFTAYAADSGKRLWSFQSGRGIMAGPMSFRVGGEQYIAVMAGYGGSMGMATATSFMQHHIPNGMILAFKLKGGATLPEIVHAPLPPANPSGDKFTAAQVEEGGKWYGAFCAICHRGPINPDLRRSATLTDADAWRAVVIDGALEANGMASFRDYLTPAQAESIRAFVSGEARALQKAGE